jgi:hypothetical protein
MVEALRFFKSYEIWIYVFLAVGGVVYLRKFIMAWRELRGAAFGLERESAQSHLNQSAGLLLVLVMMVIAEFSLVSFVAPAVPGANPLLTPTLDLLATPTTTLPAVTVEVSPVLTATVTLVPLQAAGGGSCTPEQVDITDPKDGAEISGIVTLKGTATAQNFGFFKYEVAHPGDPVWLTIQARRSPVVDGELGSWDTTTLASGDYVLRLVVTDNQGVSLPACVIRVRINNPTQP